MELWPPYNKQPPNWKKACKKKRGVCFICKRKRLKEMASQQMFKSGQARGEGRAKVDQMMDSAQSAADAARAKAQGDADATRAKAPQAAQSAQQSKEHAGSMLQQTGEHVMSMAQGAMDSVKNTLGIGDKKS